MRQTKDSTAEVRVHGLPEASGFGKLKRNARVAGAAALGALTLAAVPANGALSVSPLFDVGAGAIYEKSPATSLNNIPLSIRNVPENPGDYFPGGDGPIAKLSLKPSDYITFATVKAGANFDFAKAGKASTDSPNRWLRASTGVGFDITVPITSFATTPYGNSDFAERNYSNNPGSSQRGYGAALTYEQLTYNYPGGSWNSFMRPFVFGELTFPVGTRGYIGFGAKVTQQSLKVQTGWDRNDSLETYQNYNAASYYTAMPYFVIHVEQAVGEDHPIVKTFGDFVVGFSSILDAKCQNGMSLSKGPGFFAGLELGYRF